MKDFPSYNENFGILNDLDSSLVNKDNVNYNSSFNQARIEDITFMEYDIVPSTLRNHLENDLEPLNVELLQELLGSCDVPNDLETLLRKPFNEEQVVTNGKESDINIDQSTQHVHIDMDYDRNDKTNGNLSGNSLNESSFFKSNGDGDKVIDNFVSARDFVFDETAKVKSSRAIDEVEYCRASDNVEMVELQYPVAKKSRISNKFVDFQMEPIIIEPKPVKRKMTNRPLIVDQFTTISHQSIRENMNKSRFCLMDKNSMFPNALVSRSLKAQIVCSATSLFEFPGNSDILHSRKLLSFWMKRKNICQNVKSPLLAHKNRKSEIVIDRVEARPDASVNEISDMSIEQVRGGDSSRRTTMQMDSFTMGSDSLQKSIIQNSFEADKTVEDVSAKMVLEESAVHQTDVSAMLPIIEEDVIPRVEEPVVMSAEKMKLIDKSGVWRAIRERFSAKMSNGVDCDLDCADYEDVRVSFYELCPPGSLKKNAAIFLITLLRLAKYNKIRLFQDKFDKEIMVGLPLSSRCVL